MKERTAEQLQAEADLERAIIQYHRLHYQEEEGAFLGDWIIIASFSYTDDDATGYQTIYPGGGLAKHRALGLIEIARRGEDDE